VDGTHEGEERPPISHFRRKGLCRDTYTMGGDLHAPKGMIYNHSIDGGIFTAGRRGDSALAAGLSSSPPVSGPLRLQTSRPPDPHCAAPCAEIWSPAGGFFADPKNWRRNTVVAAVGIATVAAFIFKKSTSLEERHALPNHRIPSQRFAPQSFPASK
jgi:hypothetical protein